MKLTEKYRPKDISEFIGDVEKVKEAEKYVKSKFPVILCGPPGIGKTSAGYLIARKLGMKVAESNLSDNRKTTDLKRLSNDLKTHKLIPTLFLLDEIDGVENQQELYNAIKDTKNPVLMTANDKYRLSSGLKKYCKFLEMYPPFQGEVAKLMKRIADSEGIKDVQFTKISRDVRSSINATFYKGDFVDTEPNEFELTKDAFKENIVSSIDPAWLMDNVHEFYHGIDVYNTLKYIRYMIETEDPIYIKCFEKSKSGKPHYPNFLRHRA